MKVECLNCHHQGNYPDDKIPNEGKELACPKCKTKFFIQKPYILPDQGLANIQKPDFVPVSIMEIQQNGQEKSDQQLANTTTNNEQNEKDLLKDEKRLSRKNRKILRLFLIMPLGAFGALYLGFIFLVAESENTRTGSIGAFLILISIILIIFYIIVRFKYSNIKVLKETDQTRIEALKRKELMELNRKANAELRNRRKNIGQSRFDSYRLSDLLIPFAYGEYKPAGKVYLEDIIPGKTYGGDGFITIKNDLIILGYINWNWLEVDGNLQSNYKLDDDSNESLSEDLNQFERIHKSCSISIDPTKLFQEKLRIPIADILSIEEIIDKRNSQVTESRKSGAFTRAVLGELIAGPEGAIIGALSARGQSVTKNIEIKEPHVKIIWKNEKVPSIDLKFETQRQSSYWYAQIKILIESLKEQEKEVNEITPITSLALQSQAETKICPYCAEEIKVAAIKCKHCGSMLNDKQKPVSPEKDGAEYF